MNFNMNFNNIATVVPSLSYTNSLHLSDVSPADEIEVSDNANALMMALDMACDPSFPDLVGDNVRTAKKRDTPLAAAVLARHGNQYQQALRKAIKRSSSYQQSVADDIHEMSRVAKQRKYLHDNENTAVGRVDHLFKEALINGTVTPQVPAGDTNSGLHGLHTPNPPGRRAAQLSNYVTAETIMSNIKDVSLSPLSPPNENDNQPPPLKFKLRPRSIILEALGRQMSDTALVNTSSAAPTGSARSNSLPTDSSSTGDSLKSLTVDTSLTVPSLPYPKMQSLSSKDQKSVTSTLAPSAPTPPTSSLSSTNKPTMRRSAHIVPSTHDSSTSKKSQSAAFVLQRRSSSSAGVLTRSFSALSLRRSASKTTCKDLNDGTLKKKGSPVDAPPKVSPSHPNLRRSASSKSGFRRRTSRSSFSSLRRHSRVGIAGAPAPTMISGPNAAW